jgi:hypothetical protein
MDWKQLWEIMSAPDNVPIVAMIPLLAFYIYLAWRQAKANDSLIEQLEKIPLWPKLITAKRGRSSRDGRRKCTSGRFCCAWNFWRPSSSRLF